MCNVLGWNSNYLSANSPLNTLAHTEKMLAWYAKVKHSTTTFRVLFYFSKLQLFADICKNGEVRLVNGPGEVKIQGQVEVCLDRRWTTVCDTSWTEEDAQVVCNQLGYPKSAKLGNNLHIA